MKMATYILVHLGLSIETVISRNTYGVPFGLKYMLEGYTVIFI